MANHGVIVMIYSLALVKLTKIVATRNEINKLTNLLSPNSLYFARTANTTVKTSRKLINGKKSFIKETSIVAIFYFSAANLSNFPSLCPSDFEATTAIITPMSKTAPIIAPA